MQEHGLGLWAFGLWALGFGLWGMAVLFVGCQAADLDRRHVPQRILFACICKRMPLDAVESPCISRVLQVSTWIRGVK